MGCADPGMPRRGAADKRLGRERSVCFLAEKQMPRYHGSGNGRSWAGTGAKATGSVARQSG